MDNITLLVVRMIVAIINISLTYLFVKSYLKNTNKSYLTWKTISILVSITLISFAIYSYLGEIIIIVMIVSILSAFVMGVFCFGSKLKVATIAAFLQLIAGIVSEMLSAVIITSFQQTSIDEVIQGGAPYIQVRILSFLIYLMFIILIKYFRNARIEVVDSKLMLSLCILPIISILIIQQFAIHIVTIGQAPTLNEAITLLSIVIVNIFIFVLVETLMKQNENSKDLLLIKYQSETQQKHIHQLIDTHEHIKKISHDFRQQTDILYELCKGHNCGQMLDTLSELSNKGHMPFVVTTGNTMLDAIISSKIAESNKENIQFISDFDTQPDLKYLNIELCVLLGNSLDNAIEACVRSKSDKKIIELTLTATNAQFMYRIKNTVGEMPELSGEFLKTSKTDNLRHGIGLKSMKQTCKNMDGDMAYEYDEEYFTLWINIPVTSI